MLERRPDGSVLVTVPRYQAFSDYSATLARRGAAFQEIAGNRSLILVSALCAARWAPAGGDARVLFTQPLITRPAVKRMALAVPVGSLSSLLEALREPGIALEHVYDY